MKRFVVLLLVLLVGFGIWAVCFDKEPVIMEGTRTTSTAIVTDRAMSDHMPYLSVKLPVGNELCLWDLHGDVIPDGIAIGDTVEVTYGTQEGFDRYLIINVKKGTA